MRPSTCLLRLRRLILPLLTLPILTAPLVHVHPEADHHHGNAGHVHGGTVHLVFSPDLPCEYRGHHDESGVRDQSPAAQEITGQTAHELNHAEITYALLTASVHPTLDKPATGHALCAVAEDESARSAFFVTHTKSTLSPLEIVLTFGLSPRAPPVRTV